MHLESLNIHKVGEIPQVKACIICQNNTIIHKSRLALVSMVEVLTSVFV